MYVIKVGSRNIDGKNIEQCKLCGTLAIGGDWKIEATKKPKRGKK